MPQPQVPPSPVPGRAAATAWLALPALLVVLAALHAPTGPAEPPSGPAGSATLLGAPAPAFALPALDGGAAAITPGQMLGQVWVLNIWASWCAPCRDEHPLLMALAREQGLTLVGMSHRDDPRNAAEWLLAQGNPYRAVALDADGRVGERYGIQGVPQTLVIDRAGIVRHRHVGPLTVQAWSTELLPLLRRLQE